MRLAFTLIVFLLYFSTVVFSIAKDTQGGTPSYTKELVSLPSLDAAILPVVVATTAPIVAEQTQPAKSVVQITQPLESKKVSFLQKLILLKKIAFSKKQTPAQNYASSNADRLAVASLVTSVGGLVLLPFVGWLVLVACICGIVFGVMAKKRGTSKRGIATAGIICGIIGCALFALGYALFALGLIVFA